MQTNRASIRHPVHDYTADGRYFLTICTHNRHLAMESPEVASVVASAWVAIPDHIPGAGLDAFVVMPNHVHGILTLRRGDTGLARSLAPRTAIGHVVRSFKAAVTRELRISNEWDETPFWQAGFYDRVIRDREELGRIRTYIQNNPSAWQYDWENPNRIDDPTHRQHWNWLEAPFRP